MSRPPRLSQAGSSRAKACYDFLMKNRALTLATLLLVGPLLGCLRASQATPRPSSLVERLAELLAPQKVQVSAAAMSSSESMGTRELRIKWVAGKAASLSEKLSIATEQRYSEASPRQRSLEIGPGRILIAGIDRSSRLKSWMVIPDPRIVRSEGPGPDGTLTGQTLHMEQAEFFVSIPDDPEIVELRLYEPELNKLSLVGSIPLSR